MKKINPYRHPYHWTLYGFLKKKYEQAYILSRPYIRKKHVLDIGCGDGRLTYLISQDATKVVGIDHQEIAINFSKALAKSLNPDLKFLVHDITSKRFKLDQKFDVITCFDVIEHIEPEKLDILISNMKSHLHEHGLLILTTPNIKELKGRFFGHKMSEKHYKEYSVDGITEVLDSYGFNLLNIKGIYIPLPLPKFFDYLLNIPGFNIFFSLLIKLGNRFPKIADTLFVVAKKK